MTRDEHLAWAKKRALEYLDAGDVVQAVTSMGSDLDKHPELRANPSLMAYAILFLLPNHDERGVREWVEGFR